MLILLPGLKGESIINCDIFRPPMCAVGRRLRSSTVYIGRVLITASTFQQEEQYYCPVMTDSEMKRAVQRAAPNRAPGSNGSATIECALPPTMHAVRCELANGGFAASLSLLHHCVPSKQETIAPV